MTTHVDESSALLAGNPADVGVYVHFDELRLLGVTVWEDSRLILMHQALEKLRLQWVIYPVKNGVTGSANRRMLNDCFSTRAAMDMANGLLNHNRSLFLTGILQAFNTQFLSGFRLPPNLGQQARIYLFPHVVLYFFMESFSGELPDTAYRVL